MLTRIKIMSKILCLLMVSFLFFHCRSSNTSDPSDIHQNITFSYVCTNGTASLEPSATENTEKCIACYAGFIPASGRCVTETFPYVCTNGTASLEPSATENTEKCIACDTGYVPSDDSCVSSGRLNSKPRRHEDISFKISPDGTRVVYKADSYKLYSVPIGGGTVTRLSKLVNWKSSIRDFQISPDSTRVVYEADQDTYRVMELYSVPIGGGKVKKLNSTLVSGRGIGYYPFQISPDSTRVVYRADQDTDNVYELYSVPIGGGTVTKLNSTLVSGGDTLDFQISPDSSRVVYRADQDTYRVNELYSVPIGGGKVAKLNSTLVSGGDVFDFQISPDSSRVVYSADQDTDNVIELYSVPIGGGTVTKLNSTLVNNGDVSFYFNDNFQISPDSSRVVYRADQDTEGVYELYSVPIGGGKVKKLNSTLVSGGDVSRFQISPDSSRMVYRADQDTDWVYELYSVPIGGGTVTKLNSTLVNNGGVSYSFQISPDSSRVVYRAESGYRQWGI